MIIEGSKKKYEVIDYLKGFSILTIVLMHLFQSVELPSYINKAASLGGTGVHVFFFCSGFGLFLSQQRNNLSFIQFFKKRFLKIYIPYIVVVIVLALIPMTYAGNMSERLGALFSHIFLYKMFITKYDTSFSYPLWYMSTLFQFYFAFIPLYKLLCKVKRKLFFCSALAISVFWWVVVSLMGVSSLRPWGSFFLQYLWEFALGMCVAQYLSEGNDIKISKYYLAGVSVLGLLAGGVLGIVGGFFNVFNDVFLMIGYMSVALFIYIVFSFIKNICIKISSFSYELYLTHMTCFMLGLRVLINIDIPVVVSMVVTFGLCLMVAYSYHQICRLVISRRQK